MKKLKSRKFWIAIIVIAYGAIMGIRSLDVGDTIVTVISVICAMIAGIAYMVTNVIGKYVTDEEDYEDLTE